MKQRRYKIICVSLFPEDRARLERLTTKARAVFSNADATKSNVVRLALQLLEDQADEVF